MFLEERIFILGDKNSIPAILLKFWEIYDLDMKLPLDKCFSYFADNEPVATACYQNNVIKGVCIDPQYQGENLTGRLISRIMDELTGKGVYHFFLFTKPDNMKFFQDFNFNSVIQTANAVLLEKGYPDINDYKKELKSYREKAAGIKPITNGIIIVNCNPMTNGHLYLMEEAASKVDALHIFVLEEQLSSFPFEIRMDLVKKNTSHLKNVFIHPSSPYIISSATFPDYFLKGLKKEVVHAELDIRLYCEVIAKELDAKKRFVGEEPYCPVTSAYNEKMADLLPQYGMELIVIPRKKFGGEAISASRVREYLKIGDFSNIKKIVPQATYDFLQSKQAEPIIRKLKSHNSRH